jgi:hypothetical protein
MNREGIRLYKAKESSIKKLKKLIETDEVKKSIEFFSTYGKNKNNDGYSNKKH